MLSDIHKEKTMIIGLALLITGVITAFFNDLVSNILVLAGFVILLVFFMKRYKKVVRRKAERKP